MKSFKGSFVVQNCSKYGCVTQVPPTVQTTLSCVWRSIDNGVWVCAYVRMFKVCKLPFLKCSKRNIAYIVLCGREI